MNFSANSQIYTRKTNKKSFMRNSKADKGFKDFNQQIEDLRSTSRKRRKLEYKQSIYFVKCLRKLSILFLHTQKKKIQKESQNLQADTMNTFHAIRYLHSSDSEESRIKLVLQTMRAGLRKKGNDYGTAKKNNPIRNG